MGEERAFEAMLWQQIEKIVRAGVVRHGLKLLGDFRMGFDCLDNAHAD